MITTYPLITTIAASIVYAFLLGYLANKLRLPTIIGYLVAGILVGPFTPGFIADVNLAKQLAEVGIILLMFGVGLHFSTKDLIAVHKIAIPGALFQILVTTLVGITVISIKGDGILQGVVFGLSISVASTVVLLLSLEHNDMVHSEVGKISIGWLVVEDIIMILVIVALPIMANSVIEGNEFGYVEMAIRSILVLVKITIFIVLMIAIARRIMPALLVSIAKTRSRELMSLGTLAIALGFAFISYVLFGASFALGAFFAGFVLNESNIGRRSARHSLPLRDTFSVLFFISVGMLFDPSVIVKQPLMVLITCAVIIIGKPFAAYVITRLFRQSVDNSLTIAVSLAQVGEFSFILSGIALNLEIFSSELYDLILAGALLSISINPFLFKWLKSRESRKKLVTLSDSNKC